MNVRQLIDILQGYPPETEVELAVVAPIADAHEPMEVDRFDVAGVLPWEEDDGEVVLWLVSGEDDDVEAFLDWVEDDAEDSDEHEHEHAHDHEHDHEHGHEGEGDGPAAG
jgi:hypothetical protein